MDVDVLACVRGSVSMLVCKAEENVVVSQEYKNTAVMSHSERLVKLSTPSCGGGPDFCFLGMSVVLTYESIVRCAASWVVLASGRRRFLEATFGTDVSAVVVIVVLSVGFVSCSSLGVELLGSCCSSMHSCS